MLRNINKTIEAENTEFKIAQREVSLSSSNKRESSVDNHSDEEDTQPTNSQKEHSEPIS